MNVPFGSSHSFKATLTDAESGDPELGATLELVGLDSSGNEIEAAGVSWPLSFSEVGAGVYSVTVPAAVVSRRRNDRLTYAVTAISGTKERRARIPVTVTPDED